MVILSILRPIFLLCCLTLTGANVNINDRLSCILTGLTSISDNECTRRGCIVDHGQTNDAPWCYLDPQVVGYTIANEPVARSNGFDAHLLVKPNAHRSTNFVQISRLNILVNYLSEHILRIKITDADRKRYEVPVQSLFNIPNNPVVTDAKYSVHLTSTGGFNLIVTRKENGAKILDTSIGGLIFSDRFIQLASYLGSSDVYGLGENVHTKFRHDLNYKTFPIFARDHIIGDPDVNEYGAHPFFTVVENTGKAYGVLLLNSNAMAYTLLPSPAISLKTTGGILDLFIFVGDSPEHVVQLYTSLIGRPVMPPFWAMGFQLCRYGYKNVQQVNKVIKRTYDHNVPLDVSYLDIDYMDEYRDFTYSKEHFGTLPSYIKETKSKHHLRWTLILDPAIQADATGYVPFTQGYQRDVFVKWPKDMPQSERSTPKNVPTDKGVIYGKVWPMGPVAFPDFLKNSTVQWWKEMIRGLHKELEFDALWIDMNEPSNIPPEYLKCPIDKYWDFTIPELKFNQTLSTQTICMNTIQGEQGEFRHFDVHSLYGLSETIPTQQAIHEATGKRGFVVTRSTFPSSGKYAAHWLGDNSAKWEHMRQSIVGMLEFSLFGMSFTGADICGFAGNTTAELCLRWLQLGAYYPYSRSHNDIDAVDQDPAYWAEIGHPEVTKAAVDALRTRYQLLHYLYTRFYRSHVYGETLVRPLHHEFPQDLAARSIDQQFLLGPSIMVNPFLYENQTSVNAFVPNGSEWYRMADGFVQKVSPISGHVHIADFESHRPLLLRAGSIFPIVDQDSLPNITNTANLRITPIDLWILPNSSGQATGDLFFDDGESINTVESGNYNHYQFKLEKCQLVIEVGLKGYQAPVGSRDILQIKALKFALAQDIPNDSLEVTLNGNQTLKSLITHNTLKIPFPKALDLLLIQGVTSVLLKDKHSDKCYVYY